MSPAERLREIRENTRVSLTMAMLLTVIGTTGGIVGAGYAARDQAVSEIGRTIQATAVAERQKSDDRYLTRVEFLREVLPELRALRMQLDQAFDKSR